MTTTVRILLAASLAALGACSVSTDDLRPVGPDGCIPGYKACGYRCVPTNDPASGCGATSCGPCPVQGSTCDTTIAVPACVAPATSCTGTQYQCDGAGPCEDLARDVANCGACGHPCEGPAASCTNGVCDAKRIAANEAARGIAYAPLEDAIYWLDTSSTTGGRLMRWRSNGGSNPFDSTRVEILASVATSNSPDARAGSPTLQRVAANGAPGYPQIYLTGSRSSSTADNTFTIWRWDPTLATLAFVTDVAVASPAAVNGLAAMGAWVAYTRGDISSSVQPAISDGTTTVSPTPATPESLPLYGLAAWGPTAYFGYRGGTIASVGTTGAETVVKSGLRGIPTPALRMALWGTGSDRAYAWASESDGTVWRWAATDADAVQLHPGSGTSTQMEIAMDATRVFWLDRAAGEVWEWRPDGTMFRLARGVAPYGLAVDGSFVYFTDNSGGVGTVRRIPK